MTLAPRILYHPFWGQSPVWLRALSAALCTCVLAGCASAPPLTAPNSAPVQPEAASGFSAKPGWATTRFAVAAANPLATDAGYQI